jgi:uncharacterized small protein (DUF1192 family)
MGCRTGSGNDKMRLGNGWRRAMDLDELPKKKPDIVVGENLDLLSVADLEHRVMALESEILRVKAAIAQKQASKTAADAFFRS